MCFHSNLFRRRMAKSGAGLVWKSPETHRGETAFSWVRLVIFKRVEGFFSAFFYPYSQTLPFCGVFFECSSAGNDAGWVPWKNTCVRSWSRSNYMPIDEPCQRVFYLINIFLSSKARYVTIVCGPTSLLPSDNIAWRLAIYSETGKINNFFFLPRASYFFQFLPVVFCQRLVWIPLKIALLLGVWSR